MTHVGQRMRLGVVALVLAGGAGCGPQEAWLAEDDELAQAEGPLLGADGRDAADRGCRVVLRTLERGPVRCASGQCWWSWRDTLDVSTGAAAEGVQPGVLFRNQDSSAWSSTGATRVAGGPTGFQRYTFTLWRNGVRDGLPAAGLARARLEVAPFVRTASGARLFDHNRNPGDLDSYVLSAATGWAVQANAAACAPAPLASLAFDPGWQTRRQGALVAGRPVAITYALERLPDCRGTYNSAPAWDIRASVRFLPSGQVAEGTVRSFQVPPGQPATGDATPVPFEVLVPAGTTELEVWFKNFSGPNGTCVAWDSNLGANYRFAVEPGPLAPVQWVGNAGSCFSRLCSRQDGAPQDIVLDSYQLSRACTFVTVDVYAPGVTDGAELRPWALWTRARLTLDGKPLDSRALAFFGRVGNDYRYVFDVPKAELYYGPRWRTLTYVLEASTDGLNWRSETPRTVTRDASFCNGAWSSCAP